MRAREQIVFTLVSLFIFFVVQNYLLKQYLDAIVEKPAFDVSSELTGIQIKNGQTIEAPSLPKQSCPVHKCAPTINDSDLQHLLDPDVSVNSDQADLLYLCPDGTISHRTVLKY